MDNLLGQISSKLGSKSALHVNTDLKQVSSQCHTSPGQLSWC